MPSYLSYDPERAERHAATVDVGGEPRPDDRWMTIRELAEAVGETTGAMRHRWDAGARAACGERVRLFCLMTPKGLRTTWRHWLAFCCAMTYGLEEARTRYEGDARPARTDEQLRSAHESLRRLRRFQEHESRAGTRTEVVGRPLPPAKSGDRASDRPVPLCGNGGLVDAEA